MDWKTAIKVIAAVADSAELSKAGYIKVGYSCNNHCLFCTAEWKKYHEDRSTFAVIEEIERIVSEDKPGTIVYSGGEPTVRRDLPYIVEHARNLGVEHQVIQTNARRLADRAYLSALCEAGVTSFFVSIHGPDPEIHDHLTRASGGFSETCSGLTNLERRGASFSTNTVICQQNYRRLNELVAFLATSFPSITQAKLSYPNLQGGAADNLSDVVAPLWEVAPFVLAAIQRGDEAGIYVTTEFVPICLLGASCERASEFSVQPYNVSDLAFKISRFDHRLQAKENVFYPVCSECDVRMYCCGIHVCHHQAFGENPCFAPVSFAELCCYTDALSKR